MEGLTESNYGKGDTASGVRTMALEPDGCRM